MNVYSILDRTSGIKKSSSMMYSHVYVTGEVVVPENIHIIVKRGYLKGTVGRLVGLKFKSEINAAGHRCFYPYSVRYLVEIDGRKKPAIIVPSTAEARDDYIGPTKWVRTVKTKTEKQRPVPAPVTKFHQELEKGSWVVGVDRGAKLRFGRISRWTRHNIWAVPYGCELTDKKKEFMMNSMAQIFLLPKDAHIDELTMAILRGYNGQ